MAKINKVAAEIAYENAQEAERIALEEAQAEANIAELLEFRKDFAHMRKAAVTLLANIDLAIAYFDTAAKEDRELSMDDTEALMANFDFVGETFKNTLDALDEDYDALKTKVQPDAECCCCKEAA